MGQKWGQAPTDTIVAQLAELFTAAPEADSMVAWFRPGLREQAIEHHGASTEDLVQGVWNEDRELCEQFKAFMRRAFRDGGHFRLARNSRMARLDP
jgi:hypothetical protein